MTEDKTNYREIKKEREKFLLETKNIEDVLDDIVSRLGSTSYSGHDINMKIKARAELAFLIKNDKVEKELQSKMVFRVHTTSALSPMAESFYLTDKAFDFLFYRRDNGGMRLIMELMCNKNLTKEQRQRVDEFLSKP